jgi:hypothetical protein
MHGAKGGAKPGAGHPNWVHGERSQQAVKLRALLNEIAREGRAVIQELAGD